MNLYDKANLLWYSVVIVCLIIVSYVVIIGKDYLKEGIEGINNSGYTKCRF